jgi:hypothetical protein
MACFFASLFLLGLQTGGNYGLPRGAKVVEVQQLNSKTHPDRALILWMLTPKRYPREGSIKDNVYTCPEETTGHHYTGPTRVSLYDTAARKVINTIKVRVEHGNGVADGDTFAVPYKIEGGRHYHVPGRKRGEEGKPVLMLLRDYNGDGRAAEFALFHAENCMTLFTTLFGYSEKQDRVIQYRIKLTATTDGKTGSTIGRWEDHLFSKRPVRPGYWKYELDYRGRGGSLEKFEIHYNRRLERFEGKISFVND